MTLQKAIDVSTGRDFEPSADPRSRVPLTVAPDDAQLVTCEADNALVDLALTHIQTVIARTVTRGMLEIGEYLLETFYEGSPELFHSSRPRKHASLRLLVERCESLTLPVSRTFLGNALRMAAVAKELPAGATFLKLPPSHRIELLRVRDPEHLEQLARRCVDERLTVASLRRVVHEQLTITKTHSGRGRRPKAPLLRALDTCTLLLDDEHSSSTRLQTELGVLSQSDRQRAESVCRTLATRLHSLAKLLAAERDVAAGARDF
jgi:hypothetical protein